MINVIVLSIFIGVNLGQFKRGFCGNYPTWDYEKKLFSIMVFRIHGLVWI